VQNQTDFNKIDFTDLLSNHQTVAVKVAGSTSSGRPLNAEEMQRTLHSCAEVLALHEH